MSARGEADVQEGPFTPCDLDRERLFGIKEDGSFHGTGCVSDSDHASIVTCCGDTSNIHRCVLLSVIDYVKHSRYMQARLNSMLEIRCLQTSCSAMDPITPLPSTCFCSSSSVSSL